MVSQAMQAVPQALLQFHGDESPAQCAEPARPFIRAARMAPGFDLLNFARQFDAAQALLVDAHVDGYGGGGQVFDWSLLADLPAFLARNLILSGGLHAGNVADGIRRVRPWAVDVSSGVEVAKGIKDAARMIDFCQAVRDADRSLVTPRFATAA
jgi:phosphoribosylanthranilate isomerase